MKIDVTAEFENLTHEVEPLSVSSDRQHRLHIDRAFTGAMVGTSHAELISYTISESEFAYVGMDVFKGKLDGRQGAFAFEHGEINARGAINSFGRIIPGSGTGELEGLEGELRISYQEGKHTLRITSTL